MTNQLLVITLLCNDQPGIVKQIADIIGQYKGNWLESRMSQLSGKFAGILKVSIDAAHVNELTQALQALSTTGIHIVVENTEEYTSVGGKTFTFELVGADRLGIVSEIAQAFSQKSINIHELETQCSSMPWSGEPLFEATGIIIAPATTNTEQLLDNLQVIEDNLGVDITLAEQL